MDGRRTSAIVEDRTGQPQEERIVRWKRRRMIMMRVLMMIHGRERILGRRRGGGWHSQSRRSGWRIPERIVRRAMHFRYRLPLQSPVLGLLEMRYGHRIHRCAGILAAGGGGTTGWGCIYSCGGSECWCGRCRWCGSGCGSITRLRDSQGQFISALRQVNSRSINQFTSFYGDHSGGGQSGNDSYGGGSDGVVMK